MRPGCTIETLASEILWYIFIHEQSAVKPTNAIVLRAELVAHALKPNNGPFASAAGRFLWYC